MKPSDNPKFNEMWQDMMRQLENVLTAAYTEDGFKKTEAEFKKFDGLKAEFKKTILSKPPVKKAGRIGKDRQTEGWIKVIRKGK